MATIAISGTIIDKNTANVHCTVTLQQGDPNPWGLMVHYSYTGIPTRNDPHMVQTTQQGTTLDFEATTLQYDNQYIFRAFFYNPVNPSVTITTATLVMRTDPDGSIINLVTVEPKDRSSKMTVNVSIGTHDNYQMIVEYSPNQGMTNPITQTFNTVNVISTFVWDFIFYLTHLRKNTTYYYLLILTNVTTNQTAATYRGSFKTKRKGTNDNFPLWMYLRYHI